MRFQIALLAAAAALVGGTAQAASLELKNAVARVIVAPEDRADVKVEVVRANPKLPLSVSTFGDRVVVDGGLSHRIHNCHGMGERARVSVGGVGSVSYDEMPQLVVHTPRAVTVLAGGATVGSIGRSGSLEFHNSGCSAWTIADVAGDAMIHESGAGSVRMGSAGRLEVQLSGAANVHAVRARSGLDARLSGVGNVNVDDVAGPIEAQVSGVGRVRVASGHAGALHAGVSGMGAVEFGGTADSLDASISGLGTVRVHQVTGPVSKSVSGGGHIEVGWQPS